MKEDPRENMDLEIEFDVPEPVRSRSSFFGLDMKGWALFAPVLFGITPLCWWAISDFEFKMVTIASILVFSYIPLRIDEKTGERYGDFLLDFLIWLKSDKDVSPKWGDHIENSISCDLEEGKK